MEENTNYSPPPQSPQIQPVICPYAEGKTSRNRAGTYGCLFGCLLIGGVIILTISFFSMIGKALENLAPAISETALTINGQKFEEIAVTEDYSPNKIMLIPVTGIIIGRSEDTFGGSNYASADQLCSMLEQAEKDPEVKAVILRIDSPGGEVVAADRIYRAILKTRKAGKPVIAQMESLAASGGYYIAAGCDYIVANPMTTTGSIGVIMTALKYYELMQKIGVQTENYTSGKMKDMLSGARPTGPEEKVLVQQHIDKVYNEFVAIVAAGRPELTVEKIKNSEIGDGRIFLGTQALELKMVDALGYGPEALAKAVEMAKISSYQVVMLKKSFSLLNLLYEFSAKTNRMDVRLPGDNRVSLEAGKLYFLPAFNQ